MNAAAFGAQGQQQSQDCAFDAGVIAGAPIRVSYYLVFYFVYNLSTALQQQSSAPVWFPAIYSVGASAILFGTVLVHEFGHGTAARMIGGTISHILLWPFGGICFSTRPEESDPRKKVVNDLKVVAAGPATHVPMTACWMVLVAGALAIFEIQSSMRWYDWLNPIHQPAVQPSGYFSLLIIELLSCAVRTNVMLFLFNVFFPMYPMDGAKLMACGLMLCGVSTRNAAKVLLGLSVPACVGFILWNAGSIFGRGGGMFGGIALMMGVMCLMESWKIYQLMQARQLHKHPVFSHARSGLTQSVDADGVRAVRFNQAEVDDEETARIAPRSEPVIPFQGTGIPLGTPHQGRGRESFLQMTEVRQQERQKSVRQLEEERLQGRDSQPSGE